MKKIFQQYGFVKVVRKLALKTDKRLTWLGGETFAPAPSISPTHAKKDYILRHPWTSGAAANEICRAAIDNGYIEPGDKQGAMSDAIRVTDKGTDLVDAALFIIPIGLFVAWWGKFGQLIAGVGIGTFGAVLLALAKMLNHKYNLQLPLL